MSDQCPHCGSSLPPYWWERQLPQSKWTEQQKHDTAQRQRADLAYREFMKAVEKRAAE